MKTQFKKKIVILIIIFILPIAACDFKPEISQPEPSSKLAIEATPDPDQTPTPTRINNASEKITASGKFESLDDSITIISSITETQGDTVVIEESSSEMRNLFDFYTVNNGYKYPCFTIGGNSLVHNGEFVPYPLQAASATLFIDGSYNPPIAPVTIENPRASDLSFAVNNLIAQYLSENHPGEFNYIYASVDNSERFEQTLSIYASSQFFSCVYDTFAEYSSYSTKLCLRFVSKCLSIQSDYITPNDYVGEISDTTVSSVGPALYISNCTYGSFVMMTCVSNISNGKRCEKRILFLY